MHVKRRGQLKCDGTRAETRFRLSAKRTSPFKSAGASVHSTTGSRVVRISGSNAGYTMFRGSVKSTGLHHVLLNLEWFVDWVWNVMANAQKPDFVFRRNGRVHLNRRGRQLSRQLGSRVVRISGSNAGYTMIRGSVKSTVYPFHSPVSPSLPPRSSPCVITFQLESTTS
jgi:hypothetical protein